MPDQPINTFCVDAHGRTRHAVNADLNCPWWSFSKTLIAICALQLADSGVLRVDVPLPGKPYTLDQLLRHEAGLPDYGPLSAYREAVAGNEPAWSQEHFLQQVEVDRLQFPPGSAWAYSNVGYLLIRNLLEQTTGENLATLATNMISLPLGLGELRVATTRGEIAAGYDPQWVYHGCFTGPLHQAVRLLASLFAGRLLSGQSLGLMLKSRTLGGHLPGRPWISHGYGAGVMIGEMQSAGRAIGHSGSGPGSVSALYHFPDLPQPVTVGCFCRADDAGIVESEAQHVALSCQ